MQVWQHRSTNWWSFERSLLTESDQKATVGPAVTMCLTEKKSTCSLVLEDGSVLPGESFGAKIPADGEVGEFVLCLTAFVFEKWSPHCNQLSGAECFLRR